MATKNAKNANYLQIDNRVKQILLEEGVLLLESRQAYKEYAWTRKYYKTLPKEGYFLWIFAPIETPLTTCILLSSTKIFQKPTNLIVLEKNIKADLSSTCQAAKDGLLGKHFGTSKVVLKENSFLILDSNHSWGKGDNVKSFFDFYLDKNSKLSFSFELFNDPKNHSSIANFYLKENAILEFEGRILAKTGFVYLEDNVYLEGKNSKSLLKVKMVADKKAKINYKSNILANDESFGHSDCSGLLLNDKATIETSPTLINKSKKAILSHEASVGRVSEEILNYLASRGVSQKKAIELIVAGFLKKQKQNDSKINSL